MAPTGKDFTSIIRPARPDDCGEIARMIKDLAEHQGSGAGSSETVTAEGRGIGSSLMKEVAKIGVENSCNKMKWTCQGWDDVAIKFYKKCGGKDITEGLNCHLFNMDREELTEFAKS
ncbi:thialysine N-epsilon-acetyltransferase-like isoform X3 [Branchiostoma lanceolatum]|uniref:thialysine N-epsilon-acetyltransferase-like isoform X3 n=1 Tax=Branchiostoma lanceolatum TaxID=7740 RepID=UPI0034566E57